MVTIACRAWTELRVEGVKVPDYPRIVRAGLSEDDKVAHVLALNLARRHLTPKRARRGRRDATAQGLVPPSHRSSRRRPPRHGTAGPLDCRKSDNAGTSPEASTAARTRPDGASVMVTGIRDQRRALAALAELGDDIPGRALNLRTAERLALSARSRKAPVRRARGRSRKERTGRFATATFGKF